MLCVRSKGGEVLAPSGRVAVMSEYCQVLLLNFHVNPDFGIQHREGGKLSKLNLDVMDGVKGGVFYLSNLADAKVETPNGQTAYHAGQLTKEEKRCRADVGIRFRRNGQSERRHFLSAKLGGCKRGNTERAKRHTMPDNGQNMRHGMRRVGVKPILFQFQVGSCPRDNIIHPSTFCVTSGRRSDEIFE